MKTWLVTQNPKNRTLNINICIVEASSAAEAIRLANLPEDKYYYGRPIAAPVILGDIYRR